ncbi:hypothetical protein ACQ4M4_24495 [Leptolyngbya sp. AN02str]
MSPIFPWVLHDPLGSDIVRYPPYSLMVTGLNRHPLVAFFVERR